jgi:cellobiose-specific phosphotransferase system component IIA
MCHVRAAIRHKHEQVIELLKNSGASLKEGAAVADQLIRAASVGNTGELRLLLIGGTDSNSRDYDGRYGVVSRRCWVGCRF